MTEVDSPLRRFGALALAEPALHARFGEINDQAQFAAALSASAATLDLPLAADDVLDALKPDPVGISRWNTPIVQGSAWPPRPWLPIQVAADDSGLFVDWAYFGARRLAEPFFEGSIRHALGLPFGRLSQYRMSLSDFTDHADYTESLAPAGFIFHMSRCGSTLTAQMLAALEWSIVVSEAAPIDAVIQIVQGGPVDDDEQQDRLLAAMIAAYGRRRIGDEQHYVVKLDSWHTLALPLFARAFPSVPWVFLYRDPIEVLVSQLRRPGIQMVPEFVPPSRYGIEAFDGVPEAEYYACVLEKICRAVVENAGTGRGLFINYSELPEAVFGKIMPHFGTACSDTEREAMGLVTQRDAKAPSFAYAADSAAKRAEASKELRAATELHVGGVYRALEALRTGR